jgi:hypothetical protein
LVVPGLNVLFYSVAACIVPSQLNHKTFLHKCDRQKILSNQRIIKMTFFLLVF